MLYATKQYTLSDKEKTNAHKIIILNEDRLQYGPEYVRTAESCTGKLNITYFVAAKWHKRRGVCNARCKRGVKATTQQKSHADGFALVGGPRCITKFLGFIVAVKLLCAKPT